MSLTTEQVREVWKELIGCRTLKKVTVKGGNPDLQVYMQYYKGKCQIVIKDGEVFNNFEIAEALDSTIEYQKAKNIIEAV